MGLCSGAWMKASSSRPMAVFAVILRATLLVGLTFESLTYFIITFMLRDKVKDNPKIVDYW